MLNSLFVNIGRGVINGGPASLLIAYTLWYVQQDLACYNVHN